MDVSGEELRQWKGRDLLDSSGDKIGTVEDFYYDDATGRAQWLLVKTGLFGTKKTLVPANELGFQGDKMTVPYTEDRVKDGPRVDEDEALTEAQEQELYSYYNLDYVSSAQPVTWGPGREASEDEMRRMLGRPSQCVHLDAAIMMQAPVPKEEEEEEA